MLLRDQTQLGHFMPPFFLGHHQLITYYCQFLGVLARDEGVQARTHTEHSKSPCLAISADMLYSILGGSARAWEKLLLFHPLRGKQAGTLLLHDGGGVVVMWWLLVVELSGPAKSSTLSNCGAGMPAPSASHPAHV